MSVSSSIPFSRSIARTASTISRLMPSPFVDQVAPHDRVVRDVHGLAAGGDADRAAPGGDELAAEALPAFDRGRGAHHHAATHRTLEVGGLAQRSLEARRRDVDAVLAPIGIEDGRHPLAERVVD